MPGFWAGIWSGSTLTVTCPYCKRSQTISRRPPCDVSCKHCRRIYRASTSDGPGKPAPSR
jgi:ribosomal protein S27E